MSKPVKRQGSTIWYYRESTPTDVRAILKSRGLPAPKEVWLSLETADVRVAKGNRVKAQAQQHSKWDTVRNSAAPVLGIPSKQEVAEAVAEHVFNLFVREHRSKLRDVLGKGLDVSYEAKRRREKIVQAELLPTTDDTRDMERASAALCREIGWDLGPGHGVRGERWADVMTMVTRAVQYARSQIADTLDGQPNLPSPEEVLHHVGGPRRPKARPNEDILSLFETYSSDARRDGKSADTLDTESKIIAHFAGYIGADRSVSDIGPRDISAFKRALSQVPHRWRAKKELSGMCLGDAAAHWQRTGGQCRSLRIVAREVSAVSSVFVWMVENGYADQNPARGFAVFKADKSKTKYPPTLPRNSRLCSKVRYSQDVPLGMTMRRGNDE